MSRFNTHSNHPLIPNANEYLSEQKFVSIHSEDRDMIKYPNSSEFEIELPQDYCNVQSLNLTSWSFPSNYNVFSDLNENRKMSFKFTEVYDPSAHGVFDATVQQIYDILSANIDHEFIITIEEGYYDPESMATELTTKFNAAVNYFLMEFDTSLIDSYDVFVIVYNTVQQTIWFGNTRDQFQLVNDSAIFVRETGFENRCYKKNVLPQYANWGLPSFLGFTRCSITARAPEYSTELLRTDGNVAPYQTSSTDIIIVPRMFYSVDINPVGGEPGMWLLPDAALTGSKVYFLKAPMKINLMGAAYFYLELSGYNCIDETSPYNLSKFTVSTNQTNGVVNSAFAKLGITSTPVSQWYDDSSPAYKWFYPPAERIRRLKVKLRYHNGQMPEFGNFDYSFMLQFNILNPQIERKSTVFPATS